jgi:hypothetical protein
VRFKWKMIMTLAPQNLSYLFNLNGSNTTSLIDLASMAAIQTGPLLPPSMGQKSAVLDEAERSLPWLEGKWAQKTLADLAHAVSLNGKVEKADQLLLSQIEKDLASGHPNEELKELLYSVKALFNFFEEFEPVAKDLRLQRDKINHLSDANTDSAASAFASFAAALAPLFDLFKKYEHSPHLQTALAALKQINQELLFSRNAIDGFFDLFSFNDFDAKQISEIKNGLTKLSLALPKREASLAITEKVSNAIWEIGEFLLNPWNLLSSETKTQVKEEREESRKLMQEISESLRRILNLQETAAPPGSALDHPVDEAETLQNHQAEMDTAARKQELKGYLHQLEEHAKQLAIENEIKDQIDIAKDVLDKEPSITFNNRLEIKLNEICRKIAVKQHRDRLSQVLENLSSLKIDLSNDDADRLAQHILGNAFGMGSGLEGFDSIKVVEYVLKVLEKRIDAINDRGEIHDFCKDIAKTNEQQSLAVFEKMASQFKIASKITKDFKEGNPQKYVDAVRSEIQNLDLGKSFFFMGGWPKHAIVYEIIKEKEDSFTFRVYNRGAGTEYHQQAVFSAKSFTLPFTELVEVPASRLMSYSFLKSLYELEHPLQHLGEEALQLYRAILPSLGGKMSHNSYTADQLMEDIKVGHCSYLSLTGLVSQMLHSEDHYNRWEFELHFQTLTNYFRALNKKNRLATDKRARRVLHKGSEQFAKTAREAYEKGLINMKELEFANRHIIAIQDAVREEEKRFLEKKAINAPRFSIEKAALLQKAGSSSLPVYQKMGLSGGDAIEISLSAFDLKSFHHDIKKFRGDFSNTLVSKPSIEKALSIKESIREWVLGIPLDEIKKIGDLFLETKGAERAVEDGNAMILELAEIGKDFLFCWMRSNQFEKDIGVDLPDYLVLIKLITIADSLTDTFSNSKKFPGTRCASFKHLCQKGMQEVIDGRSGVTHSDARWQKEIQALRKYWNERKDGKPDDGKPSFFGFEDFPASTYPNKKEVLGERWYHADSYERGSYPYWSFKIKWEDLHWAEDWIGKADHRDLFDSEVKNGANEDFKKALQKLRTPFDQAAFLLNPTGGNTDLEKSRKKLRDKIFPQSYFNLRDLSFAVDFIVNHDWDLSEVELDRKRDFVESPPKFVEPPSKRDQGDLIGLWQFLPLRPFVAPQDLIDIKDVYGNVKTPAKIKRKTATTKEDDKRIEEDFVIKGTGKGGIGRPDRFKANFALENRQDGAGTGFEELFHTEKGNNLKGEEISIGRRRIDPHEITQKKTSLENTTIQEKKELLALNGIPSQQIVNTFGYYSLHSEKLQDPKHQSFFKKLMFEPPYLLEELQSPYGKKLAEELKAFCKNGYEFSINPNTKNYHSAAFFIEISSYISEIVSMARGGAAAEGFIDPRTALSKLLDEKNLDLSEKTHVFTGLLKTYAANKPPVKKEEFADLIAASVWMQRSPSNPKLDGYFSNSVASSYLLPLFRFQKKIRVALANDPNWILNRVAERIGGQKSAKSWKIEKTGIWITDDGQNRLDLFRAKLFEKETAKSSAPLPFRIASQVPVQNLLESEGQEVAPGEYLARGADGTSYRLVESANGKGIAVFRKIDGRELKFIKPPSSIPKSLHFAHMWLTDSKDPKPQIYLTHPVTGKFITEVEIRNVKSKNNGYTETISYDVHAIHGVSPDGKRQPVQLGDATVAGFKALHGIESKDYIRVWVDSNTKHPLNIELPRLGLSFAVKDDSKAVSDQHAGYKISKDQTIKALDDLSNYLVMEKEGGQEKLILVPVQPFMSQDQKALSAPLFPDRSLKDEKGLMGAVDGPRFSLLYFNLKANGQLKPSEEGRLYLAMLRLWQQDLMCEKDQCYAEAEKSLCWYGSQTRTYTENEEKILQWIITLANQNYDTDPRSLAVRTKAAYWLVKNKVDFGNGLDLHDEKEGKWVDAAAENYEQYLQKFNKIPDRYKLDEEDLNFLATHISRSKKFQRNAQNKAMAGSGQISEETKPVNVKILEKYSRILNSDSPKDKEEQINEFIRDFLWKLQFQSEAGDRRSLLDPAGLLNKIEELYQLAREKSPDNLINLYNRLTGDNLKQGLSLKDLSEKLVGRSKQDKYRSETELLKEEILYALNLIMLGKGKENELGAGSILAAAIKYPDSMPETKEFKTLLDAFRKAQNAMDSNKKFDGIENKCSMGIRWVWNDLLSDIKIHVAKDGTVKKFDDSSLEAPKISSPEPSEECPAPENFIQTSLPSIGQQFVQLFPPTKVAMREKSLSGWEFSKIFHIENADGPIQRSLEELKDKIAEYADSDEACPQTLNPKSSQEIKGKKEELENLIKQSKEKTAKLEQELISKANLTSKAIKNAEIDQLKLSKIASGDEKSIDLDELLYLFIAQDADKLRLRNPTLSQEDVREIFTLTQKFLLEATSKQYLERLFDQLERSFPGIEKYEETYKRTSRLIELRSLLTIANPTKPFDSKSYNEIRKELTDDEIRNLYSDKGNPLVQEPVELPPEIPHWLSSRLFGSTVDREKALEILDQKINKGKQRYPDFQRNLAEITRIGNAKREYSVASHPEYLVFEYYMDILLRNDQVVNIEKLAESGGSVMEMIMGSGKTSVLLPLMAIRKADGKTLPLLIMPRHMLGSMASELQQRLKDGFNQLIDVLEFKRKKRSFAELERIEERVIQALSKKKAVLMSDSSLKTFFLEYVEHWTDKIDRINLNPNEIQNAEQNRKGVLDAYRRIFSLMNGSVDLILDEVDLLLDVLKTHHFTTGEGESIHPDVLQTTADFYQWVVDHPELQMKWNFKSSHSDKANPLTAAHYEEFKKKVVDKIAEGKFAHEILGSFLENLNVWQKKQLSAYLGGKSADLSFLDKAPSKVKNTLAVVKEELNTFLPLTAKKQVNEHYGPIPEKDARPGHSKHMAIPYHGSNNPMVRSEFGTDLEIINYCIQLHLAQGISKELIREKVVELKEAMVKERQKNIPDVKNQGLLGFEKIRGPHDMSLTHIKEEDLEKIQLHVNGNRRLQFEFIRSMILPNLKVYNRQLKTTAHIFPLLSNLVRGCSGTLWNSLSYPLAFKEKISSSTEPITLLTLWDEKEKVIDLPSGISPLNMDAKERIRQFLEPMIQKTKGSVIDLGGVFRGIPNIEVAKVFKQILGKENKKGIVYLNEKDQVMVLMPQNDQPILLKESGLGKRELLAYWDQQHTTGIDITVSPTMKATLTVSVHTMMRDLLQAVWRLRGLGKGQKIEFAILPEDKEMIVEILNKQLGLKIDPNQLTLKELFLYAKYIEAVRQGDDNFRALRQKLDAILIEPVLKALLAKNTSEEILEPLIETLFVNKKETDPFKLYGAVESQVDVDEAVKVEVARAKQMIEKIEPAMRQLGISFDAKKASQRIETIVDHEKQFLPKKIVKKERYSLETEVELELENQVNKEQIDETDFGDPSLTPWPIVFWPMKEAFTDGYFQPVASNEWKSWKGEKLSIQKDIDATLKQLEFRFSKVFQKSKGKAPVVRIQEVLNHYHPEEAAFFDHNLLASMNFMPVYSPSGKQPSFQPFGPYRDSSRYSLIVHDTQSNTFQYTMLDAWDAHQWELFLTTDNTLLTKNRRIALYHWDLGDVASSRTPIDPKKLKSHEFLKLHVQAKFLSGEITYSQEERGTLKKWIQEIDSARACEFFKKKALKMKDQNQKDLGISDIGKIFAELGQHIEP